MLLCYEVTRDLPLEMIEIETPLAQMTVAGARRQEAGVRADCAPACGFLEGMLDLVPSARVAHIGLYRDPQTLVAVEYYFKAPDDMAGTLVMVLHPMLATGNSAVAAVDRLKESGAKTIRIVVPAGDADRRSRGCAAHHPDVHIWTAAIDDAVNRGWLRVLPGSRRCWRSDVW